MDNIPVHVLKDYSTNCHLFLQSHIHTQLYAPHFFWFMVHVQNPRIVNGLFSLLVFYYIEGNKAF